MHPCHPYITSTDVMISHVSLYNAGVYNSLNDNIIPDHGYVVISDIDYVGTGRTALICHTNRPVQGGSVHSGGDWISPYGVIIVSDVSGDVPGFESERGPMMVRLWRDSATGSPAEGMYRCDIYTRH